MTKGWFEIEIKSGRNLIDVFLANVIIAILKARITRARVLAGVPEHDSNNDPKFSMICLKDVPRQNSNVMCNNELINIKPINTQRN